MSEQSDTSIYTEYIMEQSMSLHNKHELECPDCCEMGRNPNCGDEITLEINWDGEVISDMAFTGFGCAISQASTSIMIDLVKGKTRSEALELTETFLAMIKREITDESELECLEDAVALKNVCNMPARVKCAVLAWHTLQTLMESSCER